MSYSWLDALQRVRAIAQTGLTYGRDEYDLERYRELAALAEQGLAELLRVSPETMSERYVLEKGYPTPKVDVRTAVFSGDRILLVRESADGLGRCPVAGRTKRTARVRPPNGKSKKSRATA